jgi:antitoxin YefM
MAAARLHAMTPRKKEQAMRTIENQEAEDAVRAILALASLDEAATLQGPSGKVIVMSEKEHKDLMRAKNNAEYLAMIDEAKRQVKEGKVVYSSLEELKAMME